MKISKEGKAKQKKLYKAIVGSSVDNYPSTVDIKATQLPEMKDWKIGETYDVMLKLKMRSMSEGGYDGKQPFRGTFEIVGSGKPETESAAEDSSASESDD